MWMIKAYELFWKNFANFSGRSRRAEYWWALLDLCIINVIFDMIALQISNPTIATIAKILFRTYYLASLIPMISLSVRRLHDIDKSGWWYLLVFIPAFGPLALFIFHSREGTDGFNRYGDDPKDDY